MTHQHGRPGTGPGRTRAGTADPGRILRRRRGPLQLVLGGVLVVLILVVELLILRAYAAVNRTTAIFGQQSFLNTTLVNAQRESVLLEDQIEELPASGDLKGVTIRRSLLANQLFQAEGQGGSDPHVAETLEQARGDLALIDRHLARIKANPGKVDVRAEVAAMRPAAHRLAVSIKQLFDTEEQGSSTRSAAPSRPGPVPSACWSASAGWC